MKHVAIVYYGSKISSQSLRVVLRVEENNLFTVPSTHLAPRQSSISLWFFVFNFPLQPRPISRKAECHRAVYYFWMFLLPLLVQWPSSWLLFIHSPNAHCSLSLWFGTEGVISGGWVLSTPPLKIYWALFSTVRIFKLTSFFQHDDCSFLCLLH